MQEISIFRVSLIVLIGFCIIAAFEIRIVTYLRQMRDLLKKIAEK